MTSLEALNRICNDCEKEMAINKIRCPFRSISNEYCKEYELIKKDLEILEILKKNMSVETEYFDDDGTSKEYEFITFYDMELWENNEKEYNKIKDWLKEK